MFEIMTFTAHADFAEDRIRLDAVDEQDGQCSIHLTRRLMDRFLPLLIQRIEQSVQPGIPKQISLAMAQQELRIEREQNPLEDVIAGKDTPLWLCRTIHLFDREEAVVWSLTDDAENTAAIALVGPGPRTVLDIFLLKYQQLEWSLEVFPDWVTQPDLAVTAPRTLN